MSVVTRAAFDIGSGKTKVLVADINVDAGTLVNVHFGVEVTSSSHLLYKLEMRPFTQLFLSKFILMVFLPGAEDNVHSEMFGQGSTFHQLSCLLLSR